jgi:hypothetical protein
LWSIFCKGLFGAETAECAEKNPVIRNSQKSK